MMPLSKKSAHPSEFLVASRFFDGVMTVNSSILYEILFIFTFSFFLECL